MNIPSDTSLTDEERIANFATMRHIERVRNLLNMFVKELLDRGEDHDQTKLAPPEVAGFSRTTPTLAGSTYNGQEYNTTKDELSAELAHHYAQYRHHPEHHKQGIDDMNLIDLVEMFVDWKAASERHTNGNILKSIQGNTNRFNLSPQLVRILENTAELFDR